MDRVSIMANHFFIVHNVSHFDKVIILSGYHTLSDMGVVASAAETDSAMGDVDCNIIQNSIHRYKSTLPPIQCQ